MSWGGGAGEGGGTDLLVVEGLPLFVIAHQPETRHLVVLVIRDDEIVCPRPHDAIVFFRRSRRLHRRLAPRPTPRLTR